MGSSAMPPGPRVSVLRLVLSMCVVVGASYRHAWAVRTRPAVCSCSAVGSSLRTHSVVDLGWWQELNAAIGGHTRAGGL